MPSVKVTSRLCWVSLDPEACCLPRCPPGVVSPPHTSSASPGGLTLQPLFHFEDLMQTHSPSWKPLERRGSHLRLKQQPLNQLVQQRGGELESRQCCCSASPLPEHCCPVNDVRRQQRFSQEASLCGTK